MAVLKAPSVVHPVAAVALVAVLEAPSAVHPVAAVALVAVLVALSVVHPEVAVALLEARKSAVHLDEEPYISLIYSSSKHYYSCESHYDLRRLASRMIAVSISTTPITASM